jgi:subtilase family protein/peptidase inhibitor I9
MPECPRPRVLAAIVTIAAALGLAAPASAAPGIPEPRVPARSHAGAVGPHRTGPPGTVVAATGMPAVPGSYVVVLRGEPETVRVAAELVRRYGGTVKHRWAAALHGFSAALTARQAEGIAADPRVEYVQQDALVRLTGSQAGPPSYGLDRLDQRDLPLDRTYGYGTDAATVHAYVIDTGIRTTHRTFGGRATFGHNSVDTNNTDCNGHGTHVAGTVGGTEYGVAKGVRLVAVKVLNCQGSGSTAQVVDGINWVAANAVRPAVVNMSLGGGLDPVIDDAVGAAIEAGITFAVASGNTGQNACGQSPAHIPEAITVNATDRTDARAAFSDYGICTDIFAPGVNITSAWNSSDTATNTISGTSMATPHVTGAAALFLAAHPTATPAQVQTALTGNATPGRVSDPGDGSPNLLLYTGTAPVPPPPPPQVCTAFGQKLVNPGFESGTRGWLATEGVLGNSGGEAPRSGTGYAWLLGYGRPHTDQLRQTVTVPAGCVGSTFSFWLHVDTDEAPDDAYDLMSVEVSATSGTTRPVLFSNLDAHYGYRRYSIPVGRFAGRSVTVTFTAAEDENTQTSFVIDDTALDAF